MARDTTISPSTASPSVISAEGGVIDVTRLRVALARLSRRLRRHELAGLTPTQLAALSTVEQVGPLRLGDLAAGTMVIVEEPRYGAKVPRVEPELVESLLPLLPLRVSAGSEMARALADYVRHRRKFGRDRREEIARPLAGPLRQRHGLPDRASSDSVLCAYYHRLFLGE